MRDKAEVLDKFMEVREVKLRERKILYLRRAPINCEYNQRIRLKGKGQVGFCQNSDVKDKTSSGMFLCNDDDVAQKCQSFECKNTEESVEQDFDEVLKSPARCGNEYPKLAMLIWFLQEFEPESRMGRFWYLTRRMAWCFWRIVTFGWW